MQARVGGRPFLRIGPAPIAVMGFAAAFGIALLLIGPLGDKPVGYDTAASVLYFKRLTHHQILEAPYLATPKPVMTVIDGSLYRLGGWAAISLAATVVYALVAALGGLLMYRMAGRQAGVFAFVALLGTRALLLDASVAYGVSWAACWLLLAGFALTAERSRYGLAGIALCLAALTRLEVIVVVGGAVAIVAAATLIAPRFGIRRPDRRAWFLGLGLVAIPAMFLHDWLLTGDATYWMTVSANFSAAHTLSVRDPGELGGWLVTRYLPMIVLVALALAGVLALWQRGQTAIALGLILLIPGIVAFQFVLSIRGTYVSDRYLYLVDLALAFAAAAGFATLRVVGLSNLKLRPRVASAIAMVAVVAVAMGAGGPFAPADQAVQRQVAAQRSASANLLEAEPILRAALSPSSTSPGAPPKLVVPALLSSVATVDLGLRIPDVSELRLGPDGGLDPSRLRDGQIIYHDANQASESLAQTQLERGQAFSVGPFNLEPVAADPADGWWVYAVQQTPRQAE